jgi:hypothetical protein
MNLHRHPFDEGTITKLEIFEAYTKEWLPVFVMGPLRHICIFDLFAGTGRDQKGVAGSPIRILQQINGMLDNIIRRDKRIYLWLNEYDKDKYSLLCDCCKQYIEENNQLKMAVEKEIVKIKYTDLDFSVLFPQVITIIRRFPSLVFLDQNGIKFLSDQYFNELVTTSTVDFLYFVSSSYFFRFGERPEFIMNVQIDMQRAKDNPYKFIHRSLLEQFREKIPVDSNMKLYPFSIKKGTNIYGIIFGASHPLAVDKFLNVAWKKNAINGEANFDIDEDLSKSQLLLFEEKKPTKKESFTALLREKILKRVLRNNEEVYLFTLDQGHIPTHAAEVLKKLKKEGLINYDAPSPLVTYEQIFNNHRIIEYKINK